MKVNERLLTISRAYIATADDFNLGDELSISIEGEVVKIEHKDNQDGTENIVYHIRGKQEIHEACNGKTNEVQPGYDKGGRRILRRDK